MTKLWISLAAAALIASASPATAQLSRASSRKAEQEPTETTGTMHDHVERAEKVLNQLLAQHSATVTDHKRDNRTMAVERTQLERLKTELDSIDQAGNATPSNAGTLDTHLAQAKSIADTLANEQASASQPSGNVEIVTVDRDTLKQLRKDVEDIEHLARHEK